MEEFMERLRRRMKELIDEIEEEIEKSSMMWTPDGVLEPLVSIYEYPDKYEVIIDLPYADLDALSIEIKDGKMIVECSLREEIRFERWGAYREVRFNRYKTVVNLPKDADIDNIRIEKDPARRIIRIIIPRRII